MFMNSYFASGRPEKPTLTLSLEIVAGQVPSYDRYSECIAEIGHPAGDLVVEVMEDGMFKEYNMTLALGYPTRLPTNCGTEEKIQFYFSNLTHLDNTQMRCTVKNTHELINQMISSDPQTIYVIPGLYVHYNTARLAKNKFVKLNLML